MPRLHWFIVRGIWIMYMRAPCIANHLHKDIGQHNIADDAMSTKLSPRTAPNVPERTLELPDDPEPP